ncbi:peptidase inhibitor family I36 protein [Luteibacter jiangsuensis]|uniref:peptidase inhibitor family I36 protein n=1 Tax=Luteibacter jiangsuensis TaxID=637577 RepID=UPI003D2F5551
MGSCVDGSLCLWWNLFSGGTFSWWEPTLSAIPRQRARLRQAPIADKVGSHKNRSHTRAAPTRERLLSGKVKNQTK